MATPASPLQEMALGHVALTVVAALRIVMACWRMHQLRQRGPGSISSDVEVLSSRRQKNDDGEHWNYYPRKGRWQQRNLVNCCQLASILA
jgi:hypothetical protein